MAFIETKKLAFEYIRRDEEGNVEGITRAVDGVNLSVEQGSFISILGANGSGKSTLALHLNSLLHPTEGTVTVDGMDITDGSKSWDIRRTAGMVFQNPDNQIVGAIVEEDIAVGPENLGLASGEIFKRVNGSLALTGMDAFKHKSPSALSGGQKQRLSIAGVLAMHPKCIIFDEATAMLDPEGRAEILSFVRELNRKQHITVIWITHFMEEAIDSDAVFVMDSGRIVLSGKPNAVFSQVEMLTNIGLKVPLATRLSYDLIKEGVPLSRGILDMETLAGELIRVKSNSN